MMTTMASMPRMVQGGGREGGTGVGPQTALQSWQAQGPEPSSRTWAQSNVALFMGVMLDTGTSAESVGEGCWLSLYSPNKAVCCCCFKEDTQYTDFHLKDVLVLFAFLFT